MKITFLALSSIFTLFLTIFLCIITFSNLHETQFDLTFNQSLIAFIASTIYLVVFSFEFIKNS